MPDPVLGCDGLDTIFIQQLYKCQPNNWELTAAISGAHTLGQAKIENSGFNGWWSSPNQQGIFNNNYFRSILTKGWSAELAVNGVPGMNQWQRTDGGASSTHKEMMFDTDMCLAYRHSVNNGGVNEYLLASENKCCAWIDSVSLFGNVFTLGQPN